ncbi:uncharacterized protein BYT42DRAFT_572273 [Radiomyces spectabilis]|uniref:uncharacterized protein n=1 Tax=Radiomyces spectabilis TaxID=64574 RepID=UPI0022207C81|nr:uncharacterized protein BYT42DRAFT_572273 [Radiomyces spectabilis]KAI8377948.1 hypothetical protein BYT42DRAFT_572273 [Radiomyces spectabilis]
MPHHPPYHQFSLANSRTLNGVSMPQCLQHDLAETCHRRRTSVSRRSSKATANTLSRRLGLSTAQAIATTTATASPEIAVKTPRMTPNFVSPQHPYLPSTHPNKKSNPIKKIFRHIFERPSKLATASPHASGSSSTNFTFNGNSKPQRRPSMKKLARSLPKTIFRRSGFRPSYPVNDDPSALTPATHPHHCINDHAPRSQSRQYPNHSSSSTLSSVYTTFSSSHLRDTSCDLQPSDPHTLTSLTAEPDPPYSSKGTSIDAPNNTIVEAHKDTTLKTQEKDTVATDKNDATPAMKTTVVKVQKEAVINDEAHLSKGHTDDSLHHSHLQGSQTTMVTMMEIDEQQPPESCLQQQETQESPANADNRSIPDTEVDASAFTVQTMAHSLWKEDGAVCRREEIAEWLGTSDEFRSEILTVYMSYFDFSNESLDQSFRRLCAKLYFKAEAQQIDRILEAFANRYWACNTQDTLLCNVDIVHAVAYSLLLLNTDLHAVTENHRKMTRSKFLKNTMATIASLELPLPDTCVIPIQHTSTPLHIKQKRFSVLSQPPILCQQSSFCHNKVINDPSPGSPGLHRIFNTWRSNGLWPHLADMGFHKSDNAWLEGMEKLLKTMYDAIKAEKIEHGGLFVSEATTLPEDDEADSSPPRGSMELSSEANKSSVSHTTDRLHTRHPSGKTIHDDSFPPMDGAKTIRYSRIPPSLLDAAAALPTVIDKCDVREETLLKKEGLLMRKHLMEYSEKRSKQRGWQLCYTVIDQDGQAKMYRPVYGTKKERRRSLVLWSQSRSYNLHESLQCMSHGTMDMHLWKHDPSQPLGMVDLKHCVASPLPPPGWNGNRPHVFCLQGGDGGVWLFEALSFSSALEWVSICNYWAARHSKEPLGGGVSSIDYGWASNTPLSSAIKLPDWRPPTPCMISSTLSTSDQLTRFEEQIQALHQQLKEHRGLKSTIETRFPPRSFHRMKALTNWELRTQYLLHEVIKFRTYCDTLRCYLLKQEQKSDITSDQASI